MEVRDSVPIDPYSAVPARDPEVEDNQLRITVTNILHGLGVPANIKGYFYLREAIIYKVHHPDTAISCTKILYPAIAKMFNTSDTRVERAIRHAIEVAWRKGDLMSQKSVDGYTVSNFRKKPTNSEFIATIVDHLNLWHNSFD